MGDGRMAYRELVKEWHRGVLALEKGNWESALRIFGCIENPSSKIDFNIGCIHLAKGDLEHALQAFEQTVSKDHCLAVGFYQKGYVCLRLERYEEALNDFQLALTHLRKNSCIDYKQLGLKVVLCAWEVLYNIAAAHCRLGNWKGAQQTLEEAIGQDPKDQNPHLDAALEQVQEKIFLEPRCITQGEFFRPQKKDVDELESKDFLGQPKVISSAFEDTDHGFPGVQSQSSLKPGADSSRTRGRKIYKADTNSPKPRTALESSLALEDSPPTQQEALHSGSRPILLKVHGSYIMNIKLNIAPSLSDLRAMLQEECYQQALQMTLGYRHPGSVELTPIHTDEELMNIWQEAEDGHLTLWSQSKGSSTDRPALYQMVACHSYTAQGPEDLNFKAGDSLDILSEVNEDWLEGRCDGTVGIFPKCFATRDAPSASLS